MSEKPILAVEDLTAGYVKGEPIVHGVSMSVAKREVVGVLGPNGAGKSTVMRALAGVCPHASGRALLNGSNLMELGAAARVRAGLGFVPRNGATFPNLTVRENLRMGAYSVTDAATVQDRITEVVELVPQLGSLMSRHVTELSGGQAELVAIGLGLMSEPAILMIDEPSAGLSVGAASGIVDSLTKVVEKRHLPLMLVEQNLGVARQLCSRFYVLESGGRMVGEAADFNGAVELLESTIQGALSVPSRHATVTEEAHSMIH